MEPLYIIMVLAIGAVAGLFAGLMGIGGGIIMTPLLLLVFESMGMPAEDAALGAVSTSLAAIFFTAVPSASVHAYHGSVHWRTLAWLSPAAALASVAAAWVATTIPPVFLVYLLVALLVFSVIRIVLPKKGAASGKEPRPRWYASGGIGLAAGFFGTLTGTGGGFLVTPFLAWLGVPLIVAIGTSAGNVTVISLSATLSFQGTGLNIPALLALAPGNLVMAAVGARLANVLPAKKLSVVYAACLCLIAARLMYWIWIQYQP